MINKNGTKNINKNVWKKKVGLVGIPVGPVKKGMKKGGLGGIPLSIFVPYPETHRLRNISVKKISRM